MNGIIKQYKLKLVQVMLTKECNINCSYCYQDFGNYKKDITFMKLDTFKNIIQNFKNNDIDLNLYGGEPLLNKEIIGYIMSNDFNFSKNIKIISINTNGLFLDDKLINFIDNHRNIFHIDLSIDGNKENHDYYRKDFLGNGTYDKILSNIKNIKYKGNYTINFCVSPFTSDKLFKGIKSLYDLGFNKIKLIFLFEYIWSNKNIIDLTRNLIAIKKFKGLIDINIFKSYNFDSHECRDEFVNNYTFLPSGEVIPCPIWTSKSKNKIDFIDSKMMKTKKEKDNYIKNNIFGNKKINNLINKGPICEQIQGSTFKKNKNIINSILGKIFNYD